MTEGSPAFPFGHCCLWRTRQHAWRPSVVKFGKKAFCEGSWAAYGPIYLRRGSMLPSFRTFVASTKADLCSRRVPDDPSSPASCREEEPTLLEMAMLQQFRA